MRRLGVRILFLLLSCLFILTACRDTQNATDNSSFDAESSVEESSEPPREKLTCVPVIYLETMDSEQPFNRDAYVPASIKIVDVYGDTVVYDTGAKCKIRGNSTSSSPKKPFNFKLSEKMDLFGMGEAKKWTLLANMYDKTLIRNKLAYDFSAEIGLAYTSQSVFADVYVDDCYQGSYQLTETVEIGPSRVDIDSKKNEFLFEFEPWAQYSNPICVCAPHSGILLGLNDMDFITEAQEKYLNEYLEKAESALIHENREEIEQYFDLDSFVDAYIVHEYFKNVDVATSSTRFYLKDGKLYAGPIWDFDLASGNCSADYYKLYNNVGGTGDSTIGWYARVLWWKYLFRNDWFSELFAARYLELQPQIVHLYADNELGKNNIDTLVSDAAKSFSDNYLVAGWKIDEVYADLERVPDKDYETNLEYLRTWLMKRNQWILNTLTRSEKNTVTG